MFVSDAHVPQNVCDLILALAVVFDDFKDLMMAQQLMQTVAPGDGPPSAARGVFGGIHVHLFRMLAGLVNELAELIKKNSKTIDDPAFSRVVTRMPQQARKMWRSVLAAAESTGPNGDNFGRFIYFARNTIGFHYDAKRIARGFSSTFLKSARTPPYISRGANMAATRFYFADAAAEAALFDCADATTVKEFITAGWQILPQISHSLRELITAFVAMRGFALRNHPSHEATGRRTAESPSDDDFGGRALADGRRR